MGSNKLTVAVLLSILITIIIFISCENKNWRELKCGLWMNTKGDIGFKTSRVIAMDEDIKYEDFYLTKFDFNENLPLKGIIDTLTFKNLGNTFYKDKNNIYHYYGMSDGGSFYIFDADYATFEILGDCYAKDKNNIYKMRDDGKSNLDYKTFKTITGPGCFAKDKNGYYSWGSKIEDQDLNDKEIKAAIQKLDEMR
ncbi:DKNYY domain-containing protein [Sphingobacterium sp. SRCM116780]|uniref:DKNYY domain-containing protein n=1 Tax=Sphingobacterium sp. SRCM116780 TaxID=2907623 RepID=UPI001F3E113F|nr:DKNYY domain-containing protein [Sphingobacterium sp. SRCM116780]UIR56811.1 DKNYY domain-containing protein [Sphingobacterium sp. SRCM116780]